MKKFFSAILLTFILAGCAAAPPLKPEVSDNLRSSTIAAAFYMVNKSISYNEMVYKVLWNETRSQTSTFEGIWDVDKDLCRVMTEEMMNQHLNTIPIDEVLTDEAIYNDFADAMRAPVWVDSKRAPLKLSANVVRKLKQSGIGYVVAVRSVHFYLSTTSMNSFGPMAVPSDLRVYDVNNGEEVYGVNYPMGGRIDWGKSVRNIESNNLATLKEASRKWVRLSTEKELPKRLGLVAH